MQQHNPDEIPDLLGANGGNFSADFPQRDDDETSLLYRPFNNNPLLSSSAAPDEDPTGLPPLPITEPFSIHAPPTTGYMPGCYLPTSASQHNNMLRPLGHYQPSQSIAPYGPSYSLGASSSYNTQTTWSNPYHPAAACDPSASTYGPGLQPLGAPYSGYPGLFGSSYNTLPPPPLSHPTEFVTDSTEASSSTATVTAATRKRSREEDLNNPAKNTGGAAQNSLLPDTPPDSSSDKSDSISPSFAPAARQIDYPSPPLPQNGVQVSLTRKNRDLWCIFFAANTEMIVTKSGRCLFPTLVFDVAGLNRKKEYNIYVRAVCNDQYRYKYLQNTWTQVSESEFSHDPDNMIALHPSSPQTGAKWNGKEVDFKSLKITHFPKSKGGDILVSTMHKYFFEVVIEENSSAVASRKKLRPSDDSLVFPFHITRFVAVTAYQSARLTELKKDKNPFARGVKNHNSETDSTVHPCLPQPPYVGYPASTDTHAAAAPVPYPTPWTQPEQK